MVPAQTKIILASRSPRRAQLLRQIGLQFIQTESNIGEQIDPALSPAENVRILAFHKAREVARTLHEGVVIGSDTIVVIDGDILGKPVDAADAKAMLRRLSGKTHTVYTGFALLDAGSEKNYIDHEETAVTFRQLSDHEIDSYVASGSPMDKAGAYGIQDDYGAVFVERINGCYYTVVGFPLSKFYQALQNFIA